jgi:hypothetical protein
LSPTRLLRVLHTNTDREVNLLTDSKTDSDQEPRELQG